MTDPFKIQGYIVVFSLTAAPMPAAAGTYKIGLLPLRGSVKAKWRWQGRKGSGALRKVDITFVMSSAEREAWLAQGLRFLQGL